MKKCTIGQFKLCFIISVVFLTAALARANDQVVVADFSPGVNAEGVPNGWELKEKSGRADFSVVTDDGLHALLLRSAGTSFSIQKKAKKELREI